ncbi:MAG: hypothetical protein H7Z71_01105 [Moraxellaceae bacterium]|nr:hypothetical protein [Pseudobdellovibrionaceae bacterium]
MKNKIIVALVLLVVSSVSIQASARPFHQCERKRDKVIKEVCSSSSSVEKKKECVTFYKNAACDTVALHEQHEEL